ncbi:hypothetical protein SAMN05192583_2129 [Sphingomonas gellani]|uniref:Nuclease homologue n=1 Tax=Sphingomonas gellani TaxID=1166340 RepID=A0A1H8ECG0_9SPHN|nr:hypothetical protein SAMN05192583_2129 [Sphingomonas gellani]
MRRLPTGDRHTPIDDNVWNARYAMAGCLRYIGFYAPELNEPGGREAKRRLERMVMGETLSCRAGRRSYDRVIGICTLRGRPLGELLRARGGTEGGRGWRR